jgi:1-acyl-sn-glycerol-3-phosphate acyltransferase
VELPRRGSAAGRWLGRSVLRLLRWRVEGELPPVGKCVAIAAPHTSNWDFVYGAATMLALDLRASWIGKHTLFRWPLGILMRALGGYPVERNAAEGRVARIARLIRDSPQFLFALSPEGTRAPIEHWRSGFYHVALQARVPIWLVYFDYERRVSGLGPLFEPTGDEERDTRAIRDFYRDKAPRRPENFAL